MRWTRRRASTAVASAGAQLGIQIVGHTRVLKRNYRNTRPILSAAYAMVHDMDAAEADPGDLISSLVVPDQALREGPAPELEQLDSAESVRRHAMDWIRSRLARGVPPAVSTIHSSKGLDARHVLILNAHELDSLKMREEARRLLHIAMTRARDELCSSSARPSWIMDEVARVLQVGGAS